jgi:hypothetical protein
MSVISLEEWRKKQALISKLTSPSKPTLVWEELGLTPTEIDEQLAHSMSLYITLDRAWRNGFSVKSRFARDGAFYVAMCCSEGWITTAVDAYDDNEKWANSWAITESGMKFKKGLDDVLRNAFVEKDTTD